MQRAGVAATPGRGRGGGRRGLVARASKRTAGLGKVTGDRWETRRVKRVKRREEDARGKCTREKEGSRVTGANEEGWAG